MESAEPAVVTVGLDGSSESLAAARWAAAEAERRGGVLRLLHAWILLATEESDSHARERNQGAREVVAEGRRVVRERHPDLPVIEDLVGEQPETALLRAAAESQVLVLGTRSFGSVAGFAMGDTSQYVVGRAQGVVVLVRADLPEEGGGAAPPRVRRVAVGLSLHGSCDEVLGFAFAAAKARSLPLQAVHGRTLPGSAYAPRGAQWDAERRAYEAAERDVVAALRPWREKYPDVPVRLSVVLASSAHVAVRCSEGADLLVVGRRARHSRFGPHLGPVAHAVVHHARCPIAVVPQR